MTKQLYIINLLIIMYSFRNKYIFFYKIKIEVIKKRDKIKKGNKLKKPIHFSFHSEFKII